MKALLPEFLFDADYSQYPVREPLVARKTLLRQLNGICTKLSSKHEALLPTRTASGDADTADKRLVCVNALWVVGDIARGASHARNLELMLEVSFTDAAAVEHAQIFSAFIGYEPNVLVHLGRPEINSTGHYATKAVKVWSAAGQIDEVQLSNLDSLSADSFAVTAHKHIPLAEHQLKLSWLERESLLAKISAGVLKSSFIPLSGLKPVFVDDCVDVQETMLATAALDLPEAQARMAPLVAGFFELMDQSSKVTAEPYFDSNTNCFTQGGAMVFVGDQVAPDASLLDDHSITSVAVMPTLSKAGPNGIWMLERGPAHPVTQAFSGVRAWATTDDCNRVNLDECCNDADKRATTLTLFSTEKLARDAALAWSPAPWGAELLAGEALLHAISMADLVYLPDGGTVALTLEGATYETAAESGLGALATALQRTSALVVA